MRAVELPSGSNAGWLDAVLAYAVAQFVALIMWGARLELRMKTVEKTPEVVDRIDREVATLTEKARANERSVQSLHKKLDRLIERRTFEAEDEED